MIRNIDIKLNAAHPQLPILEATTFVGSPSAVMIHGVPPSVGAWRINAVRVVATYPDNTAHTVAAVLGAAGTWVATIPATETSGRVAQGLQIIADGTDERGESVTGYVLGIAGLAVYTRDMTIESATGVKYYIHLLDAEPADPKEGDAYLDGSALNIYHDGEWTEIAGGGYEPPPGGIPKTDLSEGVQASLGKADTALQTAPVASVNGKTGTVSLTASDVGALGNSGNQLLNGNLILRGADSYVAATEFCGSYICNTGDGRYEIPYGRTGTLALLSDIPSVAGLAPLASPAFTGTPTAPTPNEQSADTQIANKKYVDDAVVAALKKKLPYEIVSPVVTVANGAETCQLADRAVNSVTLATSAFAPAFPASPGAGLARDFFVRITAASDVTLTLPAGVTVENAAGDIPAIEGGATTILYFSEVAPNRFLLKGETVEAAT